MGNAEGSGAPSATAFVNWIAKTPQTLGGLFISILYVSIIAGKNISHIQGFLEYESHKVFYDALPTALQCVALLPAAWQCFRVSPPEHVRRSHPIAAQACDQFRKSLTALIGMWILFYFLIFLSQVKVVCKQEPWIDFLNNLQAVFLFGCYWTLTAITIPDPEENETKGREATSLLLVLNYSLWAVLVFHFADLFGSRTGAPSVRFWFQLLSGLIVGICMALLVGCLESEFLTLPGTRVLIASLYAYAVLQLAYVGFNAPQGSSSPMEKFLQEFATITSLPLKLLLIAFCYWSVVDGRLAFYMEKTRGLIRDVPSQWNDFSS